MYKSIQMFITKQHYPEAYTYFLDNARLAKNLYNASLYRIRQTFTAHNKSVLTTNEQEVQAEQALVCTTYNVKPQTVLTYHRLEKMMRATNNVDFYAGLPMQSAQHCVKLATRNFKAWLSALKAYKKDASKFSGHPKMPKYKESEMVSLTYSNQDVMLYNSYVKLPKTSVRLPMLYRPKGHFKELQVKPMYNGCMLYFIFEVEDSQTLGGSHMAALDLGVDNIAALVTNEGTASLYKGGIVKCMNQWYNKQKAKYTSILQSETKSQAVTSHRLKQLDKKRYFKLKDYFHKLSKDIIDTCISHDIGVLVIGENKSWKQKINIGQANNQNFVSIPYDMLKRQLEYKGQQAGIRVICIEEGYTSKADFLSHDTLPSLGEQSQTFSGRRISRGLYRSGTGVILNADINGACNILRKYDNTAFHSVNDFTYLQVPNVVSNLYM